MKFKTEAHRRAHFWNNIAIAGPEECWVWKRGFDKDGYGKTSFMGIDVRSHVLSFSLSIGPIAKGMMVLHSCDNPPCCNPGHLSLGTAARNARDRDTRARTGNAKLTADKVREIREMARNGASIPKLEPVFGVTYKVIWNIIHGLAWKHVA